MPESLRALIEPHFELDVHATSRECDADACTHAALANAPDLVIAAGGDGTVSMVAGALVGTSTPLGILARGTSNSIAAALGIPTDDEGAIATLASGEAQLIDTARANGRSMILHASLGVHAATIADTPRDAKNRWGVLAYLREGLVKLADLAQFDVAIETDALTIRCRAVNVAVANLAPTKTVFAQGPAVIAPSDGMLDVTIVSAESLADVIATGLHLASSAAQTEPASRDNVGFFRAHRIRVTTEPAQPLLVDGEIAGEGSVEIVCVPRSVRVVLPRGTELPRGGPSEPKLDGLPALEVETKP